MEYQTPCLISCGSHLQVTACLQQQHTKRQKSCCEVWVFLQKISIWYAGVSKILGVFDVMLKTYVGYSHGLVPHANISVYLQALLLLLCWLRLHLPTGAYKPLTSHARSPANRAPIGKLQCKLYVYSHIHTQKISTRVFGQIKDI